MTLHPIYPTERQAPRITVVKQSEMIGQAMMLKTLFNSVNMLSQPNDKLPRGPPHILEATKTEQKVSDMCSSTHNELFNLIGFPLGEGTKISGLLNPMSRSLTNYTFTATKETGLIQKSKTSLGD